MSQDKVDGQSHSGPRPQTKVKSIVASEGWVIVSYEEGGEERTPEILSYGDAVRRASAINDLLKSRSGALYPSDELRMRHLIEQLTLAAAEAAKQLGEEYESKNVKMFVNSHTPGSEFNAATP